jgi:fumarate hydratase, class I
MEEIRAELSKLPVGGLALLSGPVIVARDSTHARFAALLRETGKLPEYLSEHPVFYAGPAKTPPGCIVGSLGPTTSARMDPYVPELMARGASLVMIAKGNRSDSVTEACKRYGGFYLAAIGGAAALATKEHIAADELVDFPELGMEAARKVWLKELPVFIVTDDKGNCLYP